MKKTRHQQHKNYLLPASEAFTLSEVLLTITIIGVVSTLTVPQVVTKINQEIYIKNWKKNYSIFAQDVADIVNENGGVMPSVCKSTTYDIDACAALLEANLKNVKICNTVGSRECFPPNSKYLNNYTSDSTIRGTGGILSDGSFYDINARASLITITVDVNGFKSPNTFGKDIYQLQIVGNRALPNGAPGTNFNNWPCNSNRRTNYGVSCSAVYFNQDSS